MESLTRLPSCCSAQRVTLAVLLVLLGACTSTPQRAAPAPPPEGLASYGPLTTPGQTRYVLETTQTASPTTLMRWRDPVYPPALVPSRLLPQTLTVRLVIDTQGRVSEVQPLPTYSQVDPRYLEAFLDAVRTCTRGWGFEPLVIYTWSGPPGRRALVSEERKPYSLDYRFDFSVVDGKALVRTNRSQ